MFELFSHFRDRMIDRFVRVMCATIGIGLLVFAYDPLTNPDAPAYDRPVFDVVDRLLPLEVWGAWFAGAAALSILAAVSGRFLVYLFGMLVAMSAELSWFGAVMWARQVEGAGLTSGGIGLWILSLSLTLGTLVYPRPLDRREESDVRVETRFGDVVSLERVAERRRHGIG